MRNVNGRFWDAKVLVEWDIISSAMITAQGYLQRVGQILGQSINGNELSVSISINWESEEQARALIRDLAFKQKELRLLKKEINLTEQEISKGFVTQRVAVGKTFGWGVARGLLGRRTAGAFSMAKRNDLTMAKDRALRPYRMVTSGVDNLILELDKQKSRIEAEIIANKAR
jgi:hypothetical protein